MMKKTKGENEAWSWAMEALAVYEQVDTVLLDALLSNTPYDYGSLSNPARERLALKGLEELLSSTSNAAHATHTTFNPIVSDVAQPVQTVLDCLLHKLMEASSLGVSILDSYRVDLHNFILQKKACLPKCALQQLEDALIKGDHSSHWFLRKTSGLNKKHQDEPVRKLDQVINGVRNGKPYSSSNHLVSENPDELFEDDPLTNPSNSVGKQGKKVLVDEDKIVNGTSANSRSMQSTRMGDSYPSNELKSPLVCENVIEFAPDTADDAIVSGKRKNSKFTKKQVVDPFSMPMEHNSYSLCEKEPLRNFHEGNLSSIHDEAIAAEWIEVRDLHVKSMNNAHTEPKQTILTCNNDIPQEAKNGSGSHDSGSHDKAPSLSCEEVVNDTTRSSRAKSQMTMNQDLEESDWTEDVSCIKCNRRDQLLICSVSTCPIVVHEGCLGASANVDNRGNFYCPVCSYSHAITAYRESQENYIRAKEKVMLAKNVVTTFLNMDCERRTKAI